MLRILKEPVLHFIIVGAAVFVVFYVIDIKRKEQARREIVVSSERVEQLASFFEATWQRPPTDKELQGLVDDFVLEEVYFRKALDMGLDREDTVIRRRLRQKLEFFVDDFSLVEPTDIELAGYLSENAEKFRSSPTYTFRQIYFNPDRLGDQPAKQVTSIVDQLRAGKQVDGNPSLLPESFDRASREEVDRTFGRGFAAKLDEVATEQWHGPVVSGLGLHIVRLDARTESRLPQLDEVRSVVVREWQNEKRKANRERINKRMLDDYEVIIEWPKNQSADQL